MRKVFIDCGANIGKMTNRFYLEHKEEEYEYYAFEMNFKLIDAIKKNNPDINMAIHNKAVWIHDDGITMYLGKTKDAYGSTILKNKQTGRVRYHRPLKIESIDFSKWLLDNFSKDDYIVLKMDIEGAEYDVLDKMIKDETILYLNELQIEFHHDKFDLKDIKTKHQNIVNYLDELKAKNSFNYFVFKK